MPFPVIVDRVTKMMAVQVPVPCNPIVPLLVIVEFRTMMFTSAVPFGPFNSAVTPFNPLFALTLSLTVTLMLWLLVLNDQPST